MPLMTSFHHFQFHCSISMEVGQILGHTFSNVSKIHDPSPLWVQKWNRGKYDTQTKMVSYDLGHTRLTPSYDPKLWHVSPLPTIHPRLTFLPIWLVSTACHKIAHIVSPNHLGQISVPRASMPLLTSFHHSQFHCSIWVEIGQILGHTFLSQKSGYGHWPNYRS